VNGPARELPNTPTSSRRSLELLVQTGLSLGRERDLRQIVQAATDAGRELCGAEFGAFFYNVVNVSGERYLLYTVSGAPLEAFSRYPMPRNTEVFAPTFAGEGVVRSGDITQDPRYGHNAPHYGMPEGHLPVRSYLAVPVVGRSGEVLGGLFYGHGEKDVFREEAEGLVQTIAAQAAVAIENVRLHEQLMRKVEDLETARHEQQKEARRVTEILESTSDAVVLLDREWKCQFLNEHAARIIATKRNLLGRSLWDVYPEALGTQFQTEYEIVMNERRPRQFVTCFAPLDRWFAVRAYPAEEGISIFFRDVTRERAEERAGLENERRLRLALEAGQLGTWTWNPGTDMLDLDERAAEIFGWEAHRPVARSLLRERAVVAEDQDGTAEALRHALDTGASYTTEYRVQRPDGSMRWVVAHGVPLHGAEDASQLTGMVGTVQDITTRKNQEQALRQTEKLAATGRMAATIAHEINNPLEAVGNLIYLAKTNEGTPAEVRRQLELADEELKRVSLIAQQTLGFYRDTAQPTEFDVAAAARSIVEMFERRMQPRRISCVVDAPEAMRIRGLQGEIRQALSNLVVNAIDASPSPGAVLVRMRRVRMGKTEAQGVSILVCDRGAGIPAAIRGSLFTPFFTTKQEIGTGLGLWVTRSIAEKGGGSIRFRSRTAGTGGAATGTVFRMVLPMEPVSRRSAESGAAGS
jgi:PAS domain S-box-containing protein